MASITESFFAGGQGRALAQANPAGAFSQAFLQSRSAAQQDRQFQQQFAEQQRQFDVGTGLKQDEMTRLIEKDRNDAALKRVGPVTERLQRLGEILGNFTQTGKPPPPGIARLEADTLAEATRIYADAGDPDPAGRAQRTLEVSRVGEASLSPDEFRAAQQDALNIIQKGQENGDPKESTAALLNALTANSPELNKFALAALDTAATQQELAARAGEADVATAGARLRGARGLGVGEERALDFAVGGGGGVEVNVGTGGETGGGIDKTMRRDLQTQFLQTDDSIRAIQTLRPRITPETVGVLSRITQGFGGFLQQLPGVREIADLVPGLDAEAVAEARAVHSLILQTISQSAAALNAQASAGRISNQQIERMQQAIEAPDAFATVESTLRVFDQIEQLGLQANGRTRAILETGDIFAVPSAGEQRAPAAPEAPTTEPIGEVDMPVGERFEEIDEAGNPTGVFFMKREDGQIVQVP